MQKTYLQVLATIAIIAMFFGGLALSKDTNFYASLFGWGLVVVACPLAAWQLVKDVFKPELNQPESTIDNINP